MNFKLVFNVTGKVLLLEAVFLLFPMLTALIYGEPLTPFLLTLCILLPVGLILSRLPYQKHFYAREGFFTVGLIWVLMGLGGALPFYFSGYFRSFVDCAFECFSGFTTTGATILTDIEILPRGILFWRSLTHWMGGMGVLVLTTAILPTMGLRSHYLTQAESTGPVASKLVPKQSKTSKILYGFYCAFTVLEIVALKLAGMPLYDCFIHTFSTAGTGGFSIYNRSIGAYNDPVIELIIVVFIILFSINFSLYFLLLLRRFRDVARSDELRFFLGAVGLSTVLVAINVYPMYRSALQSLRYSLFQVVSIISTTGFCTADYVHWPVFSQVIIALLMLCGACAGSTGGGLKSARIVLCFRCLGREIRRIVHPRSVSVVKLDGKVVEEDDLRATLGFVCCTFLIVLGATLVVSLDDLPFATSFSAALTCINNVGPGLELIGPSGNFSIFSDLSKLVLSACMVIGRLEIFPILVLLSRDAWRRT